MAPTLHVGRSWTGHSLEDECPCPKSSCGLVPMVNTAPECPEHSLGAGKTLRQCHQADQCPDTTPGEWAAEMLTSLDTVIGRLGSTEDDHWAVDRVRSADGSRNCFFGHLFAIGRNDEYGSALWNAFEGRWATTYMIYPVNDGSDSRYPQSTPKQRILAYLRDLNSGAAQTTHELMAEEYAASLTEDELLAA